MDPSGLAPLFVRQSGSCDCGEACARSVLAWYHHHHHREGGALTYPSANLSNTLYQAIYLHLSTLFRYIKSMASFEGTEFASSRSGPWWSIDVMVWMRNHGVPCVLATSYLGIHDSHWQDPWYLETLPSDKIRVEQLFSQARSEAWPVVVTHSKQANSDCNFASDARTARKFNFKPAIALKDLCTFLGPECIGIVLVNSVLLNNSSGLNMSESELSLPILFVGHFVLLLGRAPGSMSDVLLFDPSAGIEGGLRCVDGEVFDAARGHPQTDQDILLCFRGDRADDSITAFVDLAIMSSSQNIVLSAEMLSTS